MQQDLFERTLIPVYAAADRAHAENAMDYLHRGMRITTALDDGKMLATDTLVASVERALSADVILVFLSPGSVERRGSGQQWERLISEANQADVPVAAFIVEPCVPPGILRRGILFDASTDPLRAHRALKRWLMEPQRIALPQPFTGAVDPANPAHLEELRSALADECGSEILPPASPLLDQFTAACAFDFEAVIRLDCLWRSEQNIVLEVGRLLGLTLTGPHESNLQAVERQLRYRRLLVALDNIDDDSLLLSLLGPRCSLIATEPAAAQPPPPAEVLSRLVQSHSNLEGALTALPAAEHVFTARADSDWSIARDLGLTSLRLLLRLNRYAEALRWCGLLAAGALRQLDRDVADEAARERAWILAAWGEAAAFPAIEPANAEQLSLF